MVYQYPGLTAGLPFPWVSAHFHSGRGGEGWEEEQGILEGVHRHEWIIAQPDLAPGAASLYWPAILLGYSNIIPQKREW